jgi:hypothetical protein
MNPIEPISKLPRWKFKEHSENEIRLNGEELVEQSDFIWKIGSVAVCGFVYDSFVNPPWMWFALAYNVGIKDLIDFRRCARYIPKGTFTAVAVDFTEAVRFAKLYGFEETRDYQDYFGRRYLIMRKV